MSDLLAASDLAVYLPSGNASLEGVAAAMLAGCPVVASAVAPIAELLTNGESAWLCAPDDPEDAARSMLLAIENAGQSRRQAEVARMCAAEVFSASRSLGQYQQMYQNLAARRPAGAGLAAIALTAG